MPFFFNHRMTHDNNVRTLGHTKSKAPKTGGIMGLQFIRSLTKNHLVSTVLMLVFEVAKRTNGQARDFVNGFHKRAPENDVA